MSKHLIDAIAKNLGISKAEAAKTAKGVFTSIQEVTAEQGSLTVINFGTFTVKRFKRTSILHKVEYNIDKNIIRFKAGAGFSTEINKETKA